MSVIYLPGYDAWKTRETDDSPYGQCDCCGRKAHLSQLWAYGSETWACDVCLGRDPDDERDEMLDDRDDRRYVDDD